MVHVTVEWSEVSGMITPLAARRGLITSLARGIQRESAAVSWWLAKGTRVKPIEVLQVGMDIWARVSEWKCAAVKYNGVWLMK